VIFVISSSILNFRFSLERSLLLLCTFKSTNTPTLHPRSGFVLASNLFYSISLEPLYPKKVFLLRARESNPVLLPVRFSQVHYPVLLSNWGGFLAPGRVCLRKKTARVCNFIFRAGSLVFACTYSPVSPPPLPPLPSKHIFDHKPQFLSRRSSLIEA
jgi:hypothetical protein